MRNHKSNRERPANWKRKFVSSLCMLLIASIMMVATSYAWLVMSVAPEVTGIATNVGANGALEIALLTTETRQDLSQIKSMGGSLATRNPSANNTWGNLLDLSYEQYGLQEMVLWPSRLDLSQTAEGYTVNSNILRVPTYGYDGRIVDLTDDTVSGIFDGKNFSAVLGESDYGVRVIGTADSLSAQSAALALAKTNIRTYMSSSNSAAKSAMDKNGMGLMSIMLMRDSGYKEADLDVLKALIADLQSSLDYIDLALRQGMIAAAASMIGNEDTFTTVKNTIQDDSKTLSELLTLLTESYEVPAGYDTWITEFNETQNALNMAGSECDALTGGSYTWEEFKVPLTYIMNVDMVYINEDLFADFDLSKAQEIMGTEVTITLASGSGVFADIADFSDDVSSMINYMGTDFTFTTMSNQQVPYLQMLSNTVAGMEAADGSVAGESSVELTSTFGYVLDMAFRTNAPISNLLLQTTPSQRVYDSNNNERTMGGGSYMEFTTTDENMGLEQMLELMDAIRVAFIDDQGDVMGIAKLNTSNRSVDNGKVKAPLYLYSFHIDEEDGSLQMDQRQTTNNVLTALEQNTAKALSVVVWLDGDLVDNSKVSATEETSLNGVLNLQFASSANLIGANNNALLDITADKTQLNESVMSATETFNAGQGLYTTESWETFAIAYNDAVTVNNNPGASEYQIYTANYALAAASSGLTEVTHEALQSKIDEIRQVVGASENIFGIFTYDEATGEFTAHDPYTQEQFDKSSVIYRVDYDKNLLDNGNGVMTSIYSDETWTALAAALYDAEKMNIRTNATNEELDNCITALQTAYEALDRQVYFMPYDYEGVIYYMAISDDTDTYGKWYDPDFNVIYSDLAILKLDSKAKPVSLGKMQQDYYISTLDGYITPYIEFLNNVYPELNNMVVKGLLWNLPAQFSLAISSERLNDLHDLVDWADDIVDAEKTDENYADLHEFYLLAQGLLNRASEITNITPAEYAEPVITELAALKLDYEWYHMTEEEKAEAEKVDMTADQATVLAAAVNAAKAVEGYADAEKTELDALRDAVKAIDELFTNAADQDGANDPTSSEAITALNNINAELEALGQTKVTAYNTLTFEVPVTSDTYEFVNVVQNTMTTLSVNGGTGVTELSVVVLTEDGVVFTITKEVEIYSPADHADIDHEAVPQGGSLVEQPVVPEWADTYQDWDNIIDAGNTVMLNVNLINREKQALDEYGMPAYTTIVNPDDEDQYFTMPVLEQIPHTETIKSYTWASSDLSILTVTPQENTNLCLITAVGIGEASINVTILTESGNTYAASYSMTVQEVEITGASDVHNGDTLDLGSVLPHALGTGESALYTWTVDGTAIAIEGEANGETLRINAVERGVATVHLTVVYQSMYDLNICTFTNSVQIAVDMDYVNGAKLEATATTVDIDKTIDLTASLNPTGDTYEQAVSYEWYLDAEDIAVLDYSDGTATVTGVKAGRVNVSVKIVTERGQTFTKTLVITVTEPVQNEVPEASNPSVPESSVPTP